MNKILITELEKLNDAFPFRAFELETLDGRRIRVTQRIRRLWSGQNAEDDIVIEGEVITVIRYADLKDVIYLVPAWKRPGHWLFYHPAAVIIPVCALFFGTMVLASQCSPRRAEPTEQHR